MVKGKRREDIRGKERMEEEQRKYTRNKKRRWKRKVGEDQ
jgi:hypothetical protein